MGNKTVSTQFYLFIFLIYLTFFGQVYICTINKMLMNLKGTTLGERLRELRDSRNLMQREVGAIIEVDGTFISKIEKNEKPINRKHLKKLSNFFEVDEDELQALWLADKLRLIIKNEILGQQAIEIVYNDFKKTTA